MGFLERAIRRGVSDAVGKAIGNAVKEAVEPKATEIANKAADAFDKAANNVAQEKENIEKSTSGLEGALGNLKQSLEGYATEVGKNLKVCPSCGEGATADKKFCPSCGAKLPEQTIAQGAVCVKCGKQNTVGTKFCQECGEKLPSAIAEEQAAADRDAKILAEWDIKLSEYPKWELGGNEFSIESGDGYIEFSVYFEKDVDAYDMVEQYRQVLRQNGFREAGEYPDKEHLYKKVDSVCYHVDTEHCFEGGSEKADIYFMNDEPTGGFDYVKPEPKKTGFFDLFK